MKNGRRLVALAASAAVLGGGFAAMAPSGAEAATYKKSGTATVKEGRKLVRQADKQKCLTVKEARKIVKGAGTMEDGTLYWYGKGKAQIAMVQYDGGKCATAAALVYDNGNAYLWMDGQVLWA